MVKELVSGLKIGEFVLQSRCHVYFPVNTIEKDMNTFISSAIG